MRSGDSYESNDNNPPPLIRRAEGDSVKEKYLIKRKPGLLLANLSEGAIIDYLENDEQPHYLLKAENTGLTIENNEKGTRELSSSLYRSFCVLTDKQIHFLVGEKGSDKHITLSYNDIVECEKSRSDYVYSFQTPSKQYYFSFDKNLSTSEIHEITEYVQKRAGLPSSTPDNVTSLTELPQKIQQIFAKLQWNNEEFKFGTICNTTSKNQRSSYLILTTHRLLGLEATSDIPTTDINLRYITNIGVRQDGEIEELWIRKTDGTQKSLKIPFDKIGEFKRKIKEEVDNSLSTNEPQAVSQRSLDISQTELRSLLQNLESNDFEHFVADVWEERGWTTRVTPAVADAGVDIIAKKEPPNSKKQLIQAKRYGRNTSVGGPEIQQYASLQLQSPDVDEVVVVTTSSFTSPAKERAEELNVTTVNGLELANLVLDSGMAELLSRYFDL